MPLPTGTYAHFKTSEGDITCRLFEQDAPNTVKNFTDLAAGKREGPDPRTRYQSNAPLYNRTTCHRVLPDLTL